MYIVLIPIRLTWRLSDACGNLVISMHPQILLVGLKQVYTIDEYKMYIFIDRDQS